MSNKKGKSKSVKQQRLMGMAYAYAKGEMKSASPEVKSVAKSFLDSDKGAKKGLKNLKDFASTKHSGLPQKVKESFKIMRFNELKEYSDDILKELYGLNNEDITGMVNDLIKCGNPKDRKEIVEDILFTLDDLDISEERYNQIQKKLEDYLASQ
jgi:hypothetical protein